MSQNVDDFERRLNMLIGNDDEPDEYVDEPINTNHDFNDLEDRYNALLNLQQDIDQPDIQPHVLDVSPITNSSQKSSAAKKLQAAYRRRNALTKYKKKKKAAKKLQTAYRRRNDLTKYKKKKKAAKTLQHAYRKRKQMKGSGRIKHGKMYGMYGMYGGTNSGTNSSELSNQQEQFDEFLSGIEEPYNPYPDAARSMAKLPQNTPLRNIDDLAVLDKIQSLVGPARREKKLKELKILTESLIENFKSNVRNLNDVSMPSVLINNYYEHILYNNTRNRYLNRVIHNDDFSSTTIQSVVKIPKDVADLLIDAMLELEDEIDPHYREVTLPKLLKYLVKDDNLNKFIMIFRLLLRLRTEYSEIDKETFINNFLEMIQP